MKFPRGRREWFSFGGVVCHNLGWPGPVMFASAMIEGFLALFDSPITGVGAILVVDAIIFGLAILYMIFTHKDRERCSMKIGGHRFYKRRPLPKKQYSLGNLLTIYLVLSQNLIQGVGAELLRQNFEEVNNDQVDANRNYDTFSLMARSEQRVEVQSMPSPHDRTNAIEDSDDISHGGDGNQNGSYFQMAFLFLQDGSVATGRVNWDDYWAMHRDIALLAQCRVDHLVANFHVPHPPRDLEEMDVQVVLPIRQQDVQHSSHVVYVLIDIEYHEVNRFDMTPTRRFSTHFPLEASRLQVLRKLEVEDYCNSLGHSCLVWVNHVIWPQQDVRAKGFKSGDYVQCALPPPENAKCEASRRAAEFFMEGLRSDEPENEETNLMQRAAQESQGSSQHGAIHTLHVRAFGSDYIEVPVEEDGPSYFEQLAINWAFSSEDFSELHEVLEPPMEDQRVGEAMFLLEMRGDGDHRLWPDDQYILFQLKIRSIPSSTMRSQKIVLWSRKFLGYYQMLALLRVDEFCRRRETRECVLSHNNRIWEVRDRSQHRISHGDFILLEAFVTDVSVPEARLCLERLGRHECDRRIFTTQQCEDDERVHDRGSNTGTHEEGSLRSRSRSRDHGRNMLSRDPVALGSVEDAPQDHGERENDMFEDRGQSLLQIRALRRLVRRTDIVSTFDRLPPPGNPSNEATGTPLSARPERSSAEEQEECTHKQTPIVFSISDDEVEQEAFVESGIEQSFILRDNRFDFVRLLQRWEDSPLKLELPQDANFRPIAWQFIMNSNAGWNNRIQQLHIYTDGSYNVGCGVASFSFAVFGWDDRAPEEQSTFVGWFADVITLDQDDPNYTGSQAHSPMEAETCGLIWGHIWLLQSGCTLPTTFHYDSMTSGHGAAGLFQIGASNIQLQKLRQLVHLTTTIRAYGSTHYQHQKSHSGCPGNECVDALAKWVITVGRQKVDIPNWQPVFSPYDNNLAWAWWHYKSISCHPEVPMQNMQQCTWNLPEWKTGMQGLQPIERPHDQIHAQIEISLEVATYNVMTLRDRQTEEGQAGEDLKGALLRDQFQSRGLHAIGLQETRSGTGGLLQTSNYIRCIGTGDNGHHGCELWLSSLIPIGHQKKKPVLFEVQTTTVVFDHPRLLVVNTRPKGNSIVFVVAHAPHDGTAEEEKDAWWTLLNVQIQKFSLSDHLIILGDMNARIGRSIPGCVGELLCDQTTDNGERLLALVEFASLWIPSTFSDIHRGACHTWTHPRGARARLDYVILSQSNSLWANYTQVDSSIQTSLTVRDHELVMASLGGVWEMSMRSRPQRRYDWEGMNTEWGRQALTAIIDNLPEPEWSTDVHVHWQILEDSIHKGLAEYFPPKRALKRIDIFSEATKRALQDRKYAKKILEAYDDFETERQQRAAYRAWKDGTSLTLAESLEWWPSVAMECARLFGLHSFRGTSKEIRRLVKQDKANFIDQVVSEANGVQGSDIYKALKPLRIGGLQRRKGIPPLPGFQGPEGIVDEEQTDDVWLRHCARMEAGVYTTSGRLVQRTRRDAYQRAKSIGAWDLNALPDLGQLESAFRRVKKQKAPGNDDLRSDLCSLASASLARKYYPLLVKIFAQAAEPYQMKGGTLIYAHKSGDRSLPDNYRGLLLSSHLGKCLRRTFRQQLIPFYQRWASDTHFSIKAGGNVSQASHALRLFISGAVQRGNSVGVLFLDIRSAYYRVVRQLITGRDHKEESIIRMMQYFDLGDTDPQALFRLLAERAHEREQELDSQREILLEEMLASTWFTSRRRTSVVESLAGTRPGDGLADLVFGLVFHRITKRITEKLIEPLHLQEHTVRGKFNLFDQTGVDCEQSAMPDLIDVVWADDLAMAWRCRGAADLSNGMQILTQTVFRECLAHALTPNLKPGKTELLMIVKGAGCKKVRAELFAQPEPMLEISEVPQNFSRVRMTASYRHLGTRIHIGLKHLLEIKCRLGQASAIYKKYRRQTFQNRLLSLNKRLYLFKSLVMSVLEFNAGTWGCLLKGEMQYLDKKLHGFYRGLVRATVDEMQLRTWNNTRIRAHVQMPDAQTLLHGARLYTI